MAADCAGRAAWQPPRATFAAVVGWLRWAEEHASLGLVLGAVGASLVAVGVAWGALALVWEHPYLVVVSLGVATLLASLAARPGGLLGCLPRGVQDALLQLTVFDLLYDDSALQNGFRRWGRLLLLCVAGRTPGDVQVLTSGLDPAWVDTVLRRTFLHWLPAPARALLLPAAREPGREWPKDSPEARVQAAAAAGVGTAGLPAELGGPPLTAARIARLLREKDEVRARLITEPDLGQVMNHIVAHQVLSIRPLFFAVTSAVLRRVRHALSVLSFSGCAFALALRFPVARGLLLKAPSVGSHEPVAARATRIASALALLSAGGAIAISACAQRLERLRQATPPPPRGARPQDHAAVGEGAAARVRELEELLERRAGEHEAVLAEAVAGHRARLEASEARCKELTRQLAQVAVPNAAVMDPTTALPTYTNGVRLRPARAAGHHGSDHD